MQCACLCVGCVGGWRAAAGCTGSGGSARAPPARRPPRGGRTGRARRVPHRCPRSHSRCCRQPFSRRRRHRFPSASRLSRRRTSHPSHPRRRTRLRPSPLWRRDAAAEARCVREEGVDLCTLRELKS